MIKKEIAVKVQDVSKSFRIPLEGSNGIKQKIINHLKGRNGYRDFTPLDNISFEIEKGDFFGIVGRNGSGKSTLLKTLAGIYSPNKGAVTVNGTLVPFIELGVGFNPELTGRENVFLNGALLGFSRDEMEAMYDGIVDFAELHDFMEERLKNYSSGMQVRLAFSIAIRAEGDILLLDEVLAVGDEAFQQKCFDYFGSLKKSKKTVILVTHDMSAVERFCNKAMLIEEGKIKKSGSSFEVAQLYRELFNEDIKRGIDTVNAENDLQQDDASKIKITSLDVKQDGLNNNLVEAGKAFSIDIEFKSDANYGRCSLGLNLINSQNLIMLATGLSYLDDKLYITKGMNRISFTIEDNIFTNDTYAIALAVEVGDDDGGRKLIFQQGDILKFAIRGITKYKHSLTHPRVSIDLKG